MGLPYVSSWRWKGLCPPLQKVPTPIPFQVQDEGGEGVLLAGHSRGSKVTGTWGPAGGLQGGGRRAAARQAPAGSSRHGLQGK